LNRQRGFTLIELTISLGIIAFMVLTAWAVISGTTTTKKYAERVQMRNHEIRIAMNRMASDISSAYISANQQQNRDEPRTMFKGKSAGDVDELRFSSLGHVTLWADSNESEQTQIYYYAESDPEDSSMTNLLRREQRRLSDENWKSEPAQVDVLLRDIEKVSFEYWDWENQEWKDDWDTSAADGKKGKLPTRVRITVEVERGDDEVKYVTQARIALLEELQFFAN
jgi:general secretion pathway protein J